MYKMNHFILYFISQTLLKYSFIFTTGFFTWKKMRLKTDLGSNPLLFLKKYFIYLFLEREEGRERERKTLMCKRNINQFLLACPQPGPRARPRRVP